MNKVPTPPIQPDFSKISWESGMMWVLEQLFKNCNKEELKKLLNKLN
jgi:hypothetical protein